jgi:hypothetical protein
MPHVPLLRFSLVCSRWFILTTFFLWSLGAAPLAEAANRYWVGGADSSRWERTQNWSTTSGGNGGASVPTAADVAIFDLHSSASGATTSSGPPVLRSAVSVLGLQLQSTFTGSLLQGTGTLTVGSSGFKVGSGRFVGGDAAIVVTGGYTQTGGIVTGIMNSMSVSGSVSITKGSSSPYSTFTSTGTLKFIGDNADQNFIVGPNVTNSFKDITINNSAGSTDDDIIANVKGGLNLSGTLTITQGNLVMSGTTLNVDGNMTLANDAQASFSGVTVFLAGNLTVGSSAIFTHDTGVFTLDGGNSTISGTVTFYKLFMNNTSAGTLTLPAGVITSVTNTLDLAGNRSTNRLSLRSSTTGTQAKISAPATVIVAYLDVKDNNVTNTTITCTTFCLDSGNNTNWSFNSGGDTTSTATTSTGGGGGGGSRRGSGGPPTPSASLKKAAPTEKSVGGPSMRDEGMARLKDRTCARVERRFKNNSKMIDRVNERLKARFSFTCDL